MHGARSIERVYGDIEMPKVDTLFRMMVEQGASDLHLISGQPPAIRINGELERLRGENILQSDGLRDLLYEISLSGRKTISNRQVMSTLVMK